MKINIQIISFWLIIGSCATTGLPVNDQSRSSQSGAFLISLKVWKIDSVNNFYLIYGRKKNSLFKIVSKKADNAAGKTIQLNRTYMFSLGSIWNSKITINGTVVSPASIHGLKCLAFDSATYICLEGDSIDDLYHAYNVKGLHWKKE